MQEPIFDERISHYFSELKPARRGLARWRQYEQEKSYLLTVVSPAMHDAAIRKLADKLHI